MSGAPSLRTGGIGAEFILHRVTISSWYRIRPGEAESNPAGRRDHVCQRTGTSSPLPCMADTGGGCDRGVSWHPDIRIKRVDTHPLLVLYVEYADRVVPWTNIGGQDRLLATAMTTGTWSILTGLMPCSICSGLANWYNKSLNAFKV